MADASDNMKFLMQQFDTAPAGTREEALMARELSEAIHMHGLQTINQDFNYSSIGKTVFGVAMAAVGVFALLSGINVGPIPVLMLVLSIIVAVIFGLEYCGIPTVSRFGTPGCSQNLIARHPAAPASSKARPIVVVAHYDTPRSDVMALPALRRLAPYFDGITICAMTVAVVAMLLHALPLPHVLRSIAYAVDIVCAVILLAGAARMLWHRYLAPYTRGANDNMSGVAALLGLLNRVRPVNGDELSQALAAMRRSEEEAANGVGETSVRGQAPAAETPEQASARLERRAARLASAPVRRGVDVLRSLGMVPDTCVIEYEQPASAEETVVAARPVAPAGVAKPATSATPAAAPAKAAAPAAPAAPASKSAPAAAQAVEDVDAEPIASSDEGNVVKTEVPAAGETVVMTRDQLRAAQGSRQAAGSAPEPAPRKPLNVIISSDEPDAELRQPAASLPRDVAQQQGTLLDDEEIRRDSILSNPAWGTTSFTPVHQNRLILEDVPDPAVAAIDPYSVSSIETIGDYNPDDFSAMDFETGTHETVTPAMLEEYRRQNEAGFTDLADEGKGRRGKRERGRAVRNSHRAAEMAAEMQEQSFTDWLGVDEDFDARKNGEQIGGWENFDADGATTEQPAVQADEGTAKKHHRWQGGATRARRPRAEREADEQAEAAQRADEDLRQAAMQLGDHDLVSHEIWFVLTGASEAQHAGMKAFLSEYDKRLRGAYFINLECVGAGRQSIVVEEGRANHRKADRRLVNLFGAASQDINRPLALARMPWRDTEATPALRRGFRAVTVCGVEGDVPARARWTGDVPETVNPGKIDDIVDIVVEVIKRS